MILLYATFCFGICNKIGELAVKADDRMNPVTNGVGHQHAELNYGAPVTGLQPVTASTKRLPEIWAKLSNSVFQNLCHLQQRMTG